MKIPKLRLIWFILGSYWGTILLPKFETGGAWWIGALIYQLTIITWMIASFLADGDYIGSGKSRAQKRRELQVQRIRELEEAERQARGGEGFEPLDLEWPAPLLDEMRERQRKEKS
jgi:hypothetical protein